MISPNPVKTTSFAYDKAGNLTGYDDGSKSASYTYDDLYRKLTETVNYGTFQLTNSYAYYKNGMKQSFTGPDGIAYQYTYDANNQLTGVQIPQVGYITYSSYKWNRPEEVILPGGSRRQYEYDLLMRVKSITAKDPGQNVLMGYQYNYDKMDNITTKTTEHGEYDYGYDELYRLIDADNPVQADETYTYDSFGNRLTSVDHTDLAYNNNNELQGYDGVTFVYDDNGNMNEKNDNGQITKFFYNIEDRLVRVEDGSANVIAEYYYDPFGLRLWKDVDGVRTYFVYSDDGLIGEYDGSGAEIKSYGYKPGSTWTTDPLFVKQNGKYYFFQNDLLGTPQKLTAVNGAEVWSAFYNSSGEAQVIPTSNTINNLRFPGQYFDQETGLNYNWHRYYDPKTGRYLRRDPFNLASIKSDGIVINSLYKRFISSKIKFFIRFYSKNDEYTIKNSLYSSFKNLKYENYIFNPIQQNFYIYAENNPISNIDPTGLASKSVWKCKFFCDLGGLFVCITLGALPVC